MVPETDGNGTHMSELALTMAEQLNGSGETNWGKHAFFLATGLMPRHDVVQWWEVFIVGIPSQQVWPGRGKWEK